MLERIEMTDDIAKQQRSNGADASAHVVQTAAEHAVSDQGDAIDRERQRAEEHLRDLQRVMADFANYRKRAEAERVEVTRYANAALIRRLCDVLDNFDRALESLPPELKQFSWVDGVWLVERQLRTILESEGLRPIEAVGKPFDPFEHEAVLHEETTSAPEGTVIAELQRGYKLHDRVIRPALVKVAKSATPITKE
jgi:molecular chaperone GrpE